MQDSVRIDRNVPMEMRDGTVLRADIFRSDDSQKHPATLIHTPYNKLAEWVVLMAVDVADRLEKEGKDVSQML